VAKKKAVSGWKLACLKGLLKRFLGWPEARKGYGKKSVSKGLAGQAGMKEISQDPKGMESPPVSTQR